MTAPKRFVYVLKNEDGRHYTGLTTDVASRLVDHNAGRCAHTEKGRPWHVDIVVEFADEARAIAFEQYLKSGSGTAFAKRHLR
jgi:predicted GIY-YIG superfamily endonuclease